MITTWPELRDEIAKRLEIMKIGKNPEIVFIDVSLPVNSEHLYVTHAGENKIKIYTWTGNLPDGK